MTKTTKSPFMLAFEAEARRTMFIPVVQLLTTDSVIRRLVPGTNLFAAMPVQLWIVGRHGINHGTAFSKS